MSKRLQVLLDESEWDDLRESAERSGLTVSEWSRRALRTARGKEPTGSVRAKLDAIRRGAEYEFPAGDIDEMNAEIESGYLASPAE